MVSVPPAALSRAQPKSSRRTLPRSSIRLSGLMSLWISPAACMAESAPKSGLMSRNSSSGGILPPRCSVSSLKLVPSTYSMTI